MSEFISKIVIVDSNRSLESQLDHNQQSNSNRHFDSTTIRFGTSNRISLVTRMSASRHQSSLQEGQPDSKIGIPQHAGHPYC